MKPILTPPSNWSWSLRDAVSSVPLERHPNPAALPRFGSFLRILLPGRGCTSLKTGLPVSGARLCPVAPGSIRRSLEAVPSKQVPPVLQPLPLPEPALTESIPRAVLFNPTAPFVSGSHRLRAFAWNKTKKFLKMGDYREGAEMGVGGA